MMYPENYMSLFAFHNTRKFKKSGDGLNWDIFSIANEADRLGLVPLNKDRTSSTDRQGYRISKSNMSYEMSLTYPTDVIVPQTITENELKKMAPSRFRSRFGSCFTFNLHD